MSLESWRDSRLIVEHETSRQEISELAEIVDTDLKDAGVLDLSPDRRLSCCYGALLTAARAALRATGFRVPKGTPSHHYCEIQSLQFSVGLDAEVLRQIEAMGKKRATADYVRVGEVSDSMVEEALAFAKNVCRQVEVWIEEKHPDLMPE